MAHIYLVTDPATDDVVDVISFCSDGCHRLWCLENEMEYAGWFGCQETSDSVCASCSTPIGNPAY